MHRRVTRPTVPPPALSDSRPVPFKFNLKSGPRQPASRLVGTFGRALFAAAHDGERAQACRR